MKTHALLSSLTLAFIGFSGCANVNPAAPAADQRGRVVVDFDHPEKYTDAKTDPAAGTDPHVLDEFRAYLVAVAGPRLAPGATLTVTFTDIDLAGDFEPWRITTHQVRIIKAIYPPRADFTWVLSDSRGAVMQQGNEKLIDSGFLSQANFTNDPLFFDKEMLDGWVRRTLRR